MDIATTLLEYGAKANAESKAGFTPLHLSAQEGHTDMSTLLIEHKADTNHKAKVILLKIKIFILNINIYYLITFFFYRMVSRRFICAHKKTKSMLHLFLLKMVPRLMLRQRYVIKKIR